MGAVATINDNRILTGASRLILPGTLGVSLEFLHICTNGVDFALRNFAVDSAGLAKNNATKVGTPVVNAGYLSLHSGADYLLTDMTETLAGTLLSVCRQVGADGGTVASRPNFIGTYAGGGASTGVSMYPSSATTIIGAANTVNATPTYQSPAGSIADTPTSWGTRMFSFDNTAIKMRNGTTGLEGSAAPTAGYTRNVSARKVIIGGGVGTAFGGFNDVVLAMGWSRVLTDVEKASVTAWATRFAAVNGVAA